MNSFTQSIGYMNLLTIVEADCFVFVVIVKRRRIINMRYKVDYSFNTPGFGEVELEAENQDIVELEAMNWIEYTFPEACDIEIDGVTVAS